MNYYSIWPDFFSIWHLEKGHVQKECGLDTCWWFRNSANQLRLVVHPIIYRVLYSIILFTSQRRNHKKMYVNHTDATPKDQPTDQQRLSLVFLGKESQPPQNYQQVVSCFRDIQGDFFHPVTQICVCFRDAWWCLQEKTGRLIIRESS